MFLPWPRTAPSRPSVSLLLAGPARAGRRRSVLRRLTAGAAALLLSTAAASASTSSPAAAATLSATCSVAATGLAPRGVTGWAAEGARAADERQGARARGREPSGLTAAGHPIRGGQGTPTAATASEASTGTWWEGGAVGRRGGRPEGPAWPEDQRLAAMAGSGSPAPSRGVRGADCAWSDGFGNGSLDGPVFAQAVFDDGSGEALYVGGDFTSAGEVPVFGIARWDGATWSALGSGTDDIVWALRVWDDGSGPALYAGGWFTQAGGVPAVGIARWDGTSWSALGSGVDDAVYALEVWDDGSGEGLYAGGFFGVAGGAPADNIARWDGSAWATLGSGVDDEVDALEVWDDGGGEQLYVGGFFNDAGGVSVEHIASWDGTAWSGLGLGTDDSVWSLAVFDDGGGPTLYAAGFFFAAGGSAVFGVAQWDGTNWSSLASGLDTPALTLVVWDDGGGEDLYIGGFFAAADVVAAQGVARWDGTAWSALGAGVGIPFFDSVDSLGVFDDGGGPRLFAGGDFLEAGGQPADYLASWDATDWSPALATGPSFLGMNDVVLTTAVFDDGSGPSLYAGGFFTLAGGVPAIAVARWTGTGWEALGDGLACNEGSFGERGEPLPGCFLPLVEAMTVWDDGTGPALYVGGLFDTAGGVAASNVARWDGTSWSALGTGTDDWVEALVVFDDGGGEDLYAGGEFLVAGGVSTQRVARWDGSAWSALGTGVDDDVETLVVYDDGAGEDLYAGGEFLFAGGISANQVARWDGSTWSALGTGTDGEVETLVVWDDGGGEDLYAGGAFDLAGGVAAPSLASWDGTAWSAVGTGVSASGFRTVDAMVPFDDGTGPRLVIGGFFEFAGGPAAGNLATWDGTTLTAFAGTVDEEVETLIVFDDGGGASLWAGGYFQNADGMPSSFIARWRCALLDYGDAADPGFPTLLASDGARHDLGSMLFLGASVDGEVDGQPGGAADGDDTDAAGDDEDGVAFVDALVAGATAVVNVTASAAGVLDAWIDWSGDGDWGDAGERIADGLALVAGVNALAVPVPGTAVAGPTVARFRFSSAGVATPSGRAPDGEVEDHAVTVAPAATVGIADLSLAEGDAGATSFDFVLTRNHSLNAVSVDVATADGTASAGSDYAALVLADLVLPAGGPLAQTVSVSVQGDLDPETDETFTVTLSGPVGVTVVDAVATGTIVNDDFASGTTPADATAPYSPNDQFVALSATVTDGTTVDVGTVTFRVFDGAVPLGAPVVSGTVSGGSAVASYLLPGFTLPGDYIIEASYSGGGGFLPSAGAATLTVTPVDDGDGVPAMIEDGAPNGGDGDGDGIPDSLQPDVTSLPSTQGPYLTLVTELAPGARSIAPFCQHRDVMVIDAGDLPPDGDALGGSYGQVRSPLDFRLECPGARATVLYFGVPSLEGAAYRKFGPTVEDATDHWYTLPADFGVTTIDGETVATAAFDLVDGGQGDHDLVVDGVIVDPGGAALAVAPIPTLGEWMLALLALLLALGGVRVLLVRG